MNRIVNQAQVAFIPSRYIFDNVLSANEIIHFDKLHK
jgi:hypothetical protein